MITSAADAVTGLLEPAGAQDYLGEPVTVMEHLLQAASLAEAAGAPPALIAAALLHDVGHLLDTSGQAGLSGAELMAGSDNHHAGRGADWLGRWFGPEVTEPVRLHVAAKRYLCGTDPGYHALLSPASRYTLSVQGGPMGAEEARRFAAGPFAGQAVRVRRWDDHAKQPGVRHEGLGHFLPLLRELDRAGQTAGPPPDVFPADGRELSRS
jgi:gamma-butyrobetaine dioxygenase